MSDSTEINKVMILTSSDDTKNTSHKIAIESFVSLIKTCSIEVSILSSLVETKCNIGTDIYFIDLYYCDWSGSIPRDILQLAKTSKVVLFNVKNDQLCEKELLLYGFVGIFYLADRPDILLKGLNQIKNNERWFKRSSMNHAFSHLLNSRKVSSTPLSRNSDKPVFPLLTKRENTIINLVTKGSQNQEIADQLNISTNTVKTHIYSIFRKTKSRNRIELITWSLQSSSSEHFNSAIN